MLFFSRCLAKRGKDCIPGGAHIKDLLLKANLRPFETSSDLGLVANRNVGVLNGRKPSSTQYHKTYKWEVVLVFFSRSSSALYIPKKLHVIVLWIAAPMGCWNGLLLHFPPSSSALQHSTRKQSGQTLSLEQS